MKLRGHDSVSGECPATEDLRAFVLGDLDQPALERTAEHIEACPVCAQTVARADGCVDELVSDLARLRGMAGDAGDVVPAELVELAREACRDSGGAEPAELIADAGRKIGRALARGPVQLGRFELLGQLGVGSFGYVFRAHDPELDRIVAIKVQRTTLPERGRDHQRFLREARSAAQLEHPNIVSLYETGETEDGVAYLVTEFIDGVTLESVLEGAPLQADEAARLVICIARALDAAHAHGVIHRDVKPSNVMIDREGAPHVMDFGLAKRDVGEDTVTPRGAVMGTPAYMSPEIARGDAHDVDARSDVYSLGVILYEMITGQRPFQGIRRMLVLQVLEDEPRPPRRLDDGIPRDLETICLKAMEKNPARRYAGAGALADDLVRFRRGEPIHARAMGLSERFGRWCRRYPFAVSLFLGILASAGFGFWHLSRLSGELIRSSAVESAEQYAEMLETVNEVYSAEVVERTGRHGIEAAADYAAREASIPLPATLLTVLLERISDGETGMRGRHYSEYPFRSRPPEEGGGPQNEFEWEALRHLKQQPDVPFKRFVDDEFGRPTLLYATARRMKQSCVTCHNSHPDSTKRDWKVGDVRGVLEIIRPLDQDSARTGAGLRSTFVLVGVIAVLFLGLSGLVAVLGTRRRRGAGASLEEENA